MITDRRVVDPALRASLVIEAALAAALDAPTAVRTVLVAAAAIAVAGSAVRRRARGRVDAAVVALAGVLAVLVLLGLLLNLFPVGLTRVSWAVGAGVLGLAAVAWGARHTPTGDVATPVPTGVLLRQGPWVLAAAGVTVVAVVVAVHATDVANRPPVQLSVTSADTSSVAVQVTGARTTVGSYQIVVRRGATELNRSQPFALSGGRSVNYSFTPTGDRLTVTLRRMGSSSPTRTLVVEPGAGAR